MSALSFAEFASVDAISPASSDGNDRAAEQTSLRQVAAPFLMVQKASPWAVSRLRRCFDCAIALCGIVFSLPILVLAALLVRITSRGPVLFRQKRMGRNGVEFTLYKFRSMRTEEQPGARITVSGDTRVTRVGSLLRRYKLDELPQFWNVLRGDMSIVGPRPKLPHHEALLLSVRPGITGPATLAFRHEEEMLRAIPEQDLDIFYEIFIKPTKARIDSEYMRDATCGSDIRLLSQTVFSCLRSPQPSVCGAYPGNEESRPISEPLSDALLRSWRESA